MNEVNMYVLLRGVLFKCVVVVIIVCIVDRYVLSFLPSHSLCNNLDIVEGMCEAVSRILCLKLEETLTAEH